MGEVINLRKARKAKARREREDAAKTARARHGASEAETALETARAEKRERDLNAHRLTEEED